MKEALLAIFPVFLQEFLDSDNEMILLQKNMHDDVAEYGKLLGLLDRNKIPKIEQFVELTVPRYTHANFRHHFRMSRETVEILIRMTGNCPEVLLNLMETEVTLLLLLKNRSYVICGIWEL